MLRIAGSDARIDRLIENSTYVEYTAITQLNNPFRLYMMFFKVGLDRAYEYLGTRKFSRRVDRITGYATVPY